MMRDIENIMALSDDKWAGLTLRGGNNVIIIGNSACKASVIKTFLPDGKKEQVTVSNTSKITKYGGDGISLFDTPTIGYIPFISETVNGYMHNSMTDKA